MATVTVRLVNRIPALRAQLRPRAGRLARRVAAGVLRDANKLMRADKSGQMYGGHQASAPGEAPAIDTGALANSGFAEPVGETAAIAGYSLETAPWLEFGTTRLAPRPFLTPAAEGRRQEYADKLKELFEP